MANNKLRFVGLPIHSFGSETVNLFSSSKGSTDSHPYLGVQSPLRKQVITIVVSPLSCLVFSGE